MNSSLGDSHVDIEPSHEEKQEQHVRDADKQDISEPNEVPNRANGQQPVAPASTTAEIQALRRSLRHLTRAEKEQVEKISADISTIVTGEVCLQESCFRPGCRIFPRSNTR